MKNLRKYALAAALVVPSVFGLGAKNSEAAKISIDKDLASGVNVRTEAALGDNVIGLINDSDNTYDIINEEGDWLKINFNGKDAYVVGKWFHILDETKLVSDANFRDGDNIDSNVIEVLKAGTNVEVIDLANNGYVKVKVNGKEGYVYNNLLDSFRKAREEKQAAQKANKQIQASNNQQAQQSNTQTYQRTQTYKQPQQQRQQVQQTQAQPSSQGSSSWAKEWIAQRESGGSYTAYNAAGGYYGRYQLNPSLVRYGASPAEQEAAADNYVAQRYGSWERAQQFWAANGWY
ncbi:MULTISPECIES: SH3 domain-containing protein [Anaerococcus]|uniref:Peptidoglycan-binding protein n=1 Tax=Anaerococcus nagyae TaxID=1755241 RepID=A0A3E2THX6_9FIRM|nr:MULTISPECIES: SH3 domain-containing protein [Anaerococcus]MDU2354078.1 SH3 domain-containing protein [Anaerococcus sp.]MDU2565916.1 SH3 domain-containing protein [Anaerococcus sp.]RGB75321.1 peptidoglycan-binding protein [Anaerococcus nagyae]